MATFRSPTWILRLPRIGPVVTRISVRAGISAIVSLQFRRGRWPYSPVLGLAACAHSLRQCQLDQVQRVAAASAASQPLSDRSPGDGRPWRMFRPAGDGGKTDGAG